MTELVSVIIPVYNVEAYVRKCVESVIGQTYKNIEIIIVDDGSTDDSGNICDEYVLKDNRVTVYHKTNGGLSDARNYGIERCHGEYISFIDSDDFVSENFIEILLKTASDCSADIVSVTGACNFWDGDNEDDISFTKDYVYTKKQCLDSVRALELMMYQVIPNGAQFRLYKTDIFKEIRFPYGYLYEDVATVYKTFLKAKRIALTEAKIYAYRKRDNSIIRQSFSEKKMVCTKIADTLIADIQKDCPVMLKAAKCRVFSMLFSVFLQIPNRNMKEATLLWNEIKKYRLMVLLDENSLMRRKNKVAALIAFFGKDISYCIGRKFGQKGSMKK